MQVLPQNINWDDPESDGLVACFVTLPGGMKNLLGDWWFPVGGASADKLRSNELGGLDTYFDGTSDSWQDPGSEAFLKIGSPWTVAWEGINDGFIDAFGCVCVLITDGTTNWVLHYTNFSGYTDIHIGGAAGGQWALGRVTVPAPFAVTGHRHWGAVTYQGSSPTSLSSFRFYLNGQELSLNAGNSLAAITDQNRIGGTSNTGTDWNGSIRQVRVYRSEWTPSYAYRYWAPETRDSLFVQTPRRRFLAEPALVTTKPWYYYAQQRIAA